MTYYAYRDADGMWKVQSSRGVDWVGRAYRRFYGRHAKRDAWSFAKAWAKRNGGVAVLAKDWPPVLAEDWPPDAGSRWIEDQKDFRA